MARQETTHPESDFMRGLPRRAAADFSADRRMLVLIAMAMVIGGASTVAAYLLINLIALVGNLAWFGHVSFAPVSLAEVPASWWVVAIPVCGGAVIGLMARFGSEKIRGHGIPEAIEAILFGRSRMSLKVAVLKPASSAISIGTGGPFGAEGPIIMTGGAIGSLFAQLFRMSSAERKTLLVAGASAGMTAIFGTPIAAVMLGVELLLFEWKPRSFIPVAAAAVVATALRPCFFETGPLFAVDFKIALPWWSLACFIAVGLVCGVFSGLLTQLLYKLEDAFERLPIHWMWWPSLGGVVIGLGGLVEPRALGVGYDLIDGFLHNSFVSSVVITVLAVKVIIWLVALSSGTSGGVLAPLLIFGGAIGWLLGLWFPGGDAGFWALLGMAAMMGGTMRAPLTATFFAVEVTGDFQQIVAVFVSSVTAYCVTVLLLKRSMLTEKIARRGHHITREYSVNVLDSMRASHVMVAEPETLPASMSVSAALDFFASATARHRFYPVTDSGNVLMGMIGRADALQWTSSPKSILQQSLGAFVEGRKRVIAHPDDSVAYLIDLMLANQSGRIAIVNKMTGCLEGLVSRQDILRLRSLSNEDEHERAAYHEVARAL
ncbi:chloride channel protein [Brucella pituitosa]|uniref:chloride channel protein n=1 Tax=Brucella pituitosa TaxID=571256 RepID=UPI0009A1C7F0|nr:chloride channel protein [Brucella pituitosa]